ncbi:MAG: QueT transporter family protein [Bacilli bacterium]|nr:QueT transporter family protein [Bacilli bacterium]
MDERIKTISYNAIICALYVAITLLSYPISFQAIQFRISELLLILCFFRKDYTAGLTLGCIISNLFSSLGPIDALFGGVATLLSCLLIGFCKHLVVAVLIPVIANAFIIGLELYTVAQTEFWVSVGWVALGELAVMIVGYIIVLLLKRNSKFHSLIRSNQNTNFAF